MGGQGSTVPGASSTHFLVMEQVLRTVFQTKGYVQTCVIVGHGPVQDMILKQLQASKRVAYSNLAQQQVRLDAGDCALLQLQVPEVVDDPDELSRRCRRPWFTGVFRE